MAGFGRQPAGTSNAGWGTPGQAIAIEGGPLRDPQTSALMGSRRIDPHTRDYVVDQYGRISGMADVQQLVQLAVHTERGSAAVRDLGQTLRSIQRVTSNFERHCLAVLTAALQNLIDLGLIEVTGFVSFKAGKADNLQPGQTYGRLRWRDLTTDEEHEELI